MAKLSSPFQGHEPSSPLLQATAYRTLGGGLSSGQWQTRTNVMSLGARVTHRTPWFLNQGRRALP